MLGAGRRDGLVFVPSFDTPKSADHDSLDDTLHLPLDHLPNIHEPSPPTRDLSPPARADLILDSEVVERRSVSEVKARRARQVRLEGKREECEKRLATDGGVRDKESGLRGVVDLDKGKGEEKEGLSACARANSDTIVRERTSADSHVEPCREALRSEESSSRGFLLLLRWWLTTNKATDGISSQQRGQQEARVRDSIGLDRAHHYPRLKEGRHQISR